MDTTVKERLLAFIQHKGLSKNKFESMCGLSKRYVSNISQSISPAVTKKISLTFPELNIGWVLTGDGDMLATDKPGATVDTVTLTGDAMKIFLNMSSTIDRQEKNISKLTEIVSSLLEGSADIPKKENAG